MKEYQETKRGYMIVPQSDFEFIQKKGDIARSTCPVCRDSRQHANDPSVRMNLRTGIGKCFHCGSKMLLKDKTQSYFRLTTPSKPQSYRLPKVDDLKLIHSDEVKSYFVRRGITDFDMLDRLHVMECCRNFRGLDLKAIAFPSYDGTALVNVMYRSLDKQFQGEKDCEQIPWNIDSALGEESLFITEGRMDALTLIQCGHGNTVSVPNGANFELGNLDRFRYSHFDALKTVYLAVDTDIEGQKLCRSLSRYFGEHRCRLVEWEWPSDGGYETAKDANECLQKGGMEAVEYSISHATECPIEGEVRAESEFDRLDDLKCHGLPPAETLNMGDFDRHVKFQTSRLYILTGLPGTGKSTFADFLAVKLLKQSHWRCSIFSPEKFPVGLHYMELAEKIMGKSFDNPRLSNREYEQCKVYMNENIFHISAEGKTDIDSLLHTARQQIIAHGVKLLLLDPFNYIDLGSDSGMTDTQKISRILITIVQFAREMDICVIVVAHPRKPGYDSRGKMIPITMFDIFGSSDFNNKCDVGIVLERDRDEDIIQVRVEKVRFDPMLGKSGMVALHYDPQSGRYGNARYDSNSSRYLKFDIGMESWLPGLGGEQQSLEFDAPSTEEEECPF